MMMINDPWSIDTSLNFGHHMDTSLSFSNNIDTSLNFSLSSNVSLSFDLASDMKLDFEKLGGLETSVITEFEPDCISLFETNARGRAGNRRKVVHCGEVPQKGQRALLWKKSYNDAPVSIGVSAWLLD